MRLFRFIKIMISYYKGRASWWWRFHKVYLDFKPKPRRFCELIHNQWSNARGRDEIRELQSGGLQL